MSTLLVVNHGTLADENSPDMILHTLAHENRFLGRPVIETPGFGSPRFNERWLRSHYNTGGLSALRAKGYMETVARVWFNEDLERLMNSGRLMAVDVNSPFSPNGVTDVVFAGWSRGCITTWYQIYYMINNANINFLPQFHVFSIDPCFGPSNWKSWIDMAMSHANLARVHECYAINESGVETVLPGVYALYPYRGTCANVTRRFLPGKHGTGAKAMDTGYGPFSYRLYSQELRDFLPAAISPYGLETAGNVMQLYIRFKIRYMQRGSTKNRFNRAQRKDLWSLNDDQKRAAGIDGSRFFMNAAEYAAYGTWPDLRRMLAGDPNKPLVDNVRNDFEAFQLVQPFGADMIRTWVKRFKALFGYSRYLKTYKAIFA